MRKKKHSEPEIPIERNSAVYPPDDAADAGATIEEDSAAVSRKPRQGNSRNDSAGRRGDKETEIPTETFFNRLAQMTEADWEKHRVYCYRRWPKISKAGPPLYIGVHRQAIDEEFLKTMYGSGEYVLKLNNQKKTLEYATFEIQIRQKKSWVSSGSGSLPSE